MSLEKFLNFLIAHNATVIEVLLGLTLLVILFLSVRIFLAAKEPGGSSPGASNVDLGSLEETLKKLIEKAGQVPAIASSPGVGSEDSQRLAMEITNLKMELENRQKQIEDMKLDMSLAGGGGGGAGGGLSGEDKSKLEAQISELQAKLTEYEIISEDIADLSFYKEQNAKLQKELETLKSQQVSAPAAAPAPAAEAAPAVAPVVEAVPAAAPVVAKPEPEIVGKAQSTEAEQSNLVDDDLMAEFAAAVEKQKAGTSEELAPTPAPPSAANAETEAAAGDTVDLGQMDMDKMLAEAADIKTTDVPGDIDPEKALGTSLDENKLLQEAAALEGVTNEDKRLMNEFENFVKKSE